MQELPYCKWHCISLTNTFSKIALVIDHKDWNIILTSTNVSLSWVVHRKCNKLLVGKTWLLVSISYSSNKQQHFSWFIVIRALTLPYYYCSWEIREDKSEISYTVVVRFLLAYRIINLMGVTVS